MRQSIIDKLVDHRKVHGISVAMAGTTADSNANGGFWQGAAGDLEGSTPRIFSPFNAQPELVGHSGLSGAFAFYAPSAKTFITGTVNQVAYPDTSFRLMLRLLGTTA